MAILVSDLKLHRQMNILEKIGSRLFSKISHIGSGPQTRALAGLESCKIGSTRLETPRPHSG